MRELLFSALLLSTISPAAVTTINVIERTAVYSGTYERITAKAHFAIDPNAPVNHPIAGIQSAPRNRAGLVQFSADLYVLKPRDPAKSNGTVLFEVSNRGSRGLLTTFNNGVSNGPREFGDGFLLDAGYTLVWVGWQFDVDKRPGLLSIDAPIARGLTGLVRTDFLCTSKTTRISFANAYPVADLQQAEARLAIRDTTFGKHTPIPRSQWHFSDPQTVEMNSPCQPGKSYDVVYTAKDPAVAGVGAAAVRDLISFLKYGGGQPTALLADQHRFLKRAIAFGSSQSGRYLRQFLLDGFNADESGRQVFDAVWPHIAGASVGSFNHLFAQPSPTQAYYPLELFPFRDLPDRDPVTRRTAGLLDRATQAKVAPKIFYTLSSNEYWGRSASLIHTTIDGAADAPLAPQTRIYHISTTQHGGGQLPLRRLPGALYESNPNDLRPVLRALLVAMQDWLTTGKEPPPSAYAKGNQLAPLKELRFPAIPGLVHPTKVRQAMPLDFGPEFLSKGIIAKEPAKLLAKPYPSKLPQLDSDGNEIGGIRLPSVAVPLATYFAWNMPAPSTYTSQEMFGLAGSHIPFKLAKAARIAARDPRPSIEERYRDRADYLAKVRAAAAALAAQGYLLESDIPQVLAHCEKHWDALTNPSFRGY